MFSQAASWIARAIEGAGIAAIALGALLSTLLFLRRLISSRSLNQTYPAFRTNLGRCILLGLELLVAADIVGTVVVAPTFANLGVLAIIVAIRIALSFALDVEINGHWPWRQAEIALRAAQAVGPQPPPSPPHVGDSPPNPSLQRTLPG